MLCDGSGHHPLLISSSLAALPSCTGWYFTSPRTEPFSQMTFNRTCQVTSCPYCSQGQMRFQPDAVPFNTGLSAWQLDLASFNFLEFFPEPLRSIFLKTTQIPSLCTLRGFLSLDHCQTERGTVAPLLSVIQSNFPLARDILQAGSKWASFALLSWMTL